MQPSGRSNAQTRVVHLSSGTRPSRARPAGSSTDEHAALSPGGLAERRPMSLNARQIEVIHVVAHTGSVTEAAVLLDVSQPAVSMMLRECNRAVGFPLFERRQGRMQPTSETLVMVPELEKILASMRRIEQLVADLRVSNVGHVRLAVVPMLADTLIPPAIAAFERERVQLSVLNAGTQDIEAEIDSGRADLGLTLSLSRSDTGLAVNLGATELICVLPRGHALGNRPFLGPEDLAQHTLIAFNGSAPLIGMIEASFASRGLRCDVACEVSDGATICALVERKVGIALIPAASLPRYRSPNLMEREFRPRSTVYVQLLLPSRRRISRAARRLEATLRTVARQVLLPAPGDVADMSA